jgi:Bacterial membrane protein YfhO
MSETSTPESSVQRKLRRLIDSPFLKSSRGHALLVVLFYSLLFTLFFSPVLFTGSLLAPGDGLLYHVAYFESKKVFWDTLLGGGFPMTADPQVMAWYPPSLILSWLPGAWNIFVLSAYVMASCFTYGYVYALTNSKLSSAASGIIYAMCGFMMAHLGHTAIIHAAVWIPLIIWSLEMLRRKFSSLWLTTGCLAVACCVLAGHLQIVVYGLILGVCYGAALGCKAATGRWRYYTIVSLVMLIGLGLAALQILPTLELASLSTRTEYVFSDFVSYSFPRQQLVQLLFPGIFGGLSGYGVPSYFGQWNLTELTGYVGLLPLMLAGVGFIVTRRRAISIFWLCAALVAFLLALGDQTPLAQLVYRLPVVGKFRVPARHFIEMALAVSVLAGIGVNVIIRRMVTRALLLKAIAVTAALMMAGLLYIVSKNSAEYAFNGGSVRLNGLPWTNAAAAVPLVIFLATALTLLYWHRNPAHRPRQILLMLVLVLDMSSFGWFYSWQEFAPSKNILRPPALAAHYQNLLRETNQRVIPVRGILGKQGELPPNLSRLWEIPSASVYGPLSLSGMTYLLSMRPDASLDPSWKNSFDQSLNLASVRYVFLPRPEPFRDAQGILWDATNMDIWLGSGCDHPPRDSVKFNLSTPLRATSLEVVSRLACAPPVSEGEEVVRVLITDSAGIVQTKTMLAGRDTAEWAYDCRTVTPQVKHRRAQVFSSFAAKMMDEPCEGHFYLATLPLDGLKDVSRIELQWAGRSGSITIEKLSLIDEPGKSSAPVTSWMQDDSRWRFVEEDAETRVYENLQAMPRAWLATEVIALKPDEILKAIKQARLPDGRAYDPARTAFVEESSPVMAEPLEVSASARITQLSSTAIEVQTAASSPAFLVMSDADYPGWQATLDDAPIRIFRANYALRGVSVPAGRHVVRFTFRPKSFYYGGALSALSLLILLGFMAFPVLRRKSAKSQLLS